MRKSVNRIVLILLLLLILPGGTLAQETKSNSVIAQPKLKEIQVSTKDMMCDYSYEHGKLYFNFEYPKVILTDNESPLIAFVDEKSEKIIFTEISNDTVNYLKIIPKYGKYFWEKWPIIFSKNDKIYVAIKKEKKWYEETGVNIFLFDKKTGELSLKENVTSVKENGAAFSAKDIYPFKDGYVIVGDGDISCGNKLGTFLSTGHLVTYKKQYSLLWDKKGSYDKQIIDEGCYNAETPAYGISDSGVFQSAWVRNTTQQSISLKHDETVLFSENKTGNEWGKPLEIYRVGNTYARWHIKNLSIANYKQSTFILWRDIQKGYFFAEIKNGSLIEVKQLLQFKHAFGEFPLGDALPAKITSDSNGNIYCLMTVQYGSRWDECQLLLKSRINGQWLEDIVISDEVVRAPDIKVDKKGLIHIAYIKYPKGHTKEKLTMKELEEEIEKQKRASCHYVKINLAEIIKEK